MKTVQKKNQPAQKPQPVCSTCSERPCSCLEDQRMLERAAALMERAARGEASPGELEAWVANYRQWWAELTGERYRAGQTLSRTFGQGAVLALDYLLGKNFLADVYAPGSDQKVGRMLRDHRYPVRQKDVAAAREYVAHRWLRPVPSAPRARAGGRS